MSTCFRACRGAAANSRGAPNSLATTWRLPQNLPAAAQEKRGLSTELYCKITCSNHFPTTTKKNSTVKVVILCPGLQPERTSKVLVRGEALVRRPCSAHPPRGTSCNRTRPNVDRSWPRWLMASEKAPIISIVLGYSSRRDQKNKNT